MMAASVCQVASGWPFASLGSVERKGRMGDREKERRAEARETWGGGRAREYTLCPPHNSTRRCNH